MASLALPNEQGSQHSINNMTDHTSDTARAGTTRAGGARSSSSSSSRDDMLGAHVAALRMGDDDDMSSEQEDWDRIIGASGHTSRTSTRIILPLSGGGGVYGGLTAAVRSKLHALSPEEAALLDKDEDRSWRSLDSVHSRTSTISATNTNSSNLLPGEDGHGSISMHDSSNSFASFGDEDGSDDDDDDEDLSMQKAAFVRLSEEPTTRRGLMPLGANKPSSLRNIKRGSSFRGSLDLIEESKESLD